MTIVPWKRDLWNNFIHGNGHSLAGSSPQHRASLQSARRFFQMRRISTPPRKLTWVQVVRIPDPLEILTFSDFRFPGGPLSFFVCATGLVQGPLPTRVADRHETVN